MSDSAALTADQVASATKVVPIDAVQQHPRNPNRGSVEAVRESVREHGLFRSIVVQRSSGYIIAGNTTWAANKAEGLSKIAVIELDISDEQAIKIMLADNRTAQVGDGYDSQVLAELLQEFDGDLDGTGWTGEDLEGLLAELEAAEEVPAEPLTDPDDVPEPGPDPVSRPGDVWQLGKHRVVCGDATDVGAYDVLLGGEKADLVWTDPPYGVSYQTDLTVEEAKRLNRRTDGLQVANDTLAEEGLQDFLRAALGAVFVASKPGACWYVAAPPGATFFDFGLVLRELEVWRQTIIWVKDQFAFGRSDYHYRHEPIFYGWKPGAAHHAVPDRSQDTVWEVPRPKRSPEHPTMKPTALITKAIENSTDPGGLVLDPFGGSGSTLITAEATGRIARLIELDPRYVDVICRRFEEHTGITPLRERDGDLAPEPVSFTASPAAAA